MTFFVRATEYTCPVAAAADNVICPVSATEICPVPTKDIYPVSAAGVLEGNENDLKPPLAPDMFSMEVAQGSPGPGVLSGARRNGGRNVETESANHARWPGFRKLKKLFQISAD